MIFLRRNIYFNMLKTKECYKFYTFNCKNKKTKCLFNYKKHIKVIIYLIEKINNKINIKEISGILKKIKKKKYLTSFNIISLKKYNNIYISFILKESPLLLDIKILK